MGKYPVYCSWCEKKGIKTVVNWSAAEGSSGICGACHEDMMRQLAAIRAASQKRGNGKEETGNPITSGLFSNF